MNMLWRWLICILASCPAAATSAGSALGTTAATDKHGALWIAHKAERDGGEHVVVRRYDPAADRWSEPSFVNSTPEPVSADGENRPKLAFGPRGEMYVTWTSPTSEKYTGDIRLSRSLDAGKRWSVPITVHRDRQLITHRFESVIVDAVGRVWVAWIDKRDLLEAQGAGQAYAGAAIYYAYSTDQGVTWQGDFKLADHSCECCRIALTLDRDGQPLAMWRHVFERNERDHALAKLTTDPKLVKVSRATADRWQIDACPHHGPSVVVDQQGTRHAVWFNQIGGVGRAFYGQLVEDESPQSVRALPEGAMHADVVVLGNRVALTWKRFDGQQTVVETWLSNDRGQTFASGPALRSSSASDQPRLVTHADAAYLVWRRADDVVTTALFESGAVNSATTPMDHPVAPSAATEVRAFHAETLREIEARHRGEPFWLVLWDLECTYCMKSLQNIAEVQRAGRPLSVVTIATDPHAYADGLAARLQSLGIRSEAYAFGNTPAEALRYAVDPKWMGEKPRAYRYAADGTRTPISGVVSPAQLQ